MRMPTVPAIEQIVRSSLEAPSRWKKRRSIEFPCTMPIVPAYEYGRIACGPSTERITSPSRFAIVASASSHVIGSKRPDPFAPVRLSGVVSRSAWYVRST
jgi:hypothetical protein